jgi:hypothetical protein
VRSACRLLGLLTLVGALLPASAGAESHYLAKQYSRCSTCHYSPTGGGLLTPYGRSLSRQELSSFGRTRDEDAEQGDGRWQEERVLYGFMGDSLAPLDLGIDLRPSQVRFKIGEFEQTRDLWMRADLQLAVRHEGWTAYAELGRLTGDDPEFISREHWLGYQSEGGFGFRLGRFLPAYGIRHVDHTLFTRRDLGFDQDDQIYGLELSDVGERHLLQFSLGPGRAESLIDDDGLAAWTFTGRLQYEPRNRHVLVLSGMFRSASDRRESQWLGGAAYGWAPWSRLTLWTELDALVTEGWDGTPQYAIFHETSFELFRGLWLKFSPQLLTELNNISGGRSRLALGIQFLPRTHWNLNLSWQRDRDRISGDIFKVLVLQLHIYL